MLDLVKIAVFVVFFCFWGGITVDDVAVAVDFALDDLSFLKEVALVDFGIEVGVGELFFELFGVVVEEPDVDVAVEVAVDFFAGELGGGLAVDVFLGGAKDFPHVGGAVVVEVEGVDDHLFVFEEFAGSRVIHAEESAHEFWVFLVAVVGRARGGGGEEEEEREEIFGEG